MAERQPLTERFWAKVEKSDDPDGCWLWTAAVTSWGYGQLSVDGVSKKAHRVAWELTNGPIPDGLFACHRCDVRLCVRPNHLFLGTVAENNRDMVAKGRQARGARQGMNTHPEARATGARNGHYTHPERTPRGERHGMAKLRMVDVRIIRASADAGVSHHELSRLFKVSRRLIRKIVVRDIWREVAA